MAASRRRPSAINGEAELPLETTGCGSLLAARFSSGFHLTCFSPLRSVSVCSRAECLIVSHPYLFDSTKFANEFGFAGTPYAQEV